jgi:hypothetical protein
MTIKKKRPAEKGASILPPIHHPELQHSIITATGQTQLGRNDQRNKMHKTEEPKSKTDSQKMFEMGIDGGKPDKGQRGISPEWFYKGTGAILR